MREGTNENVVELVVRTHQAVVYEIKTAAAPEIHIADSRVDLDSAGLRSDQSVEKSRVGSLQTRVGQRVRETYKFRARFSALQSSTVKEKKTKTGIDNRLL